MLAAELADVVRAAEVVVLGSSSPAVLQALTPLLRPEQVVIDLVRLPAGTVRLNARVQGLCW